MTPEELAQALVDNQGGYRNGISTHIQCASAYETLEDMERMGGKVRDIDDEYAGAEFRDEATKLLFAYDYTNRFVLRLIPRAWAPTTSSCPARSASGWAFASSIAPRPPACSTEGGRNGARVIGATGVNVAPAPSSS